MKHAITNCIYMVICVVLTCTSLSSATDGVTAGVEVKPWTNYEISATISPEICSRLIQSFETMPGLLPDCVIEVDGRVVDRSPLQADGKVKFCLPATVVGERSRIEVRAIPSSWRGLDDTVQPWSIKIDKARSVAHPFMSYVINIGSSSDISFVGPGFSYQEGSQPRADRWNNNQDFRWSEPGCQLRLPVVPGNTHRITLMGHVPVGFVVMSKGKELARFRHYNPECRYTFDVESEATALSRWLELKLVNLDPMPLPNLDLRQLFWAMDQVVVETRGPSGSLDFNHLPASGVADAAFSAAWAKTQHGQSTLSLSPIVRWDLPAGYKSAGQLTQEACAVRLQSSHWAVDPSTDLRDETYVSQKLLEPLAKTMQQAEEPAQAGKGRYDIAIFVSRRQLEAAQARPGNAEVIRESARGAFYLMQQLQIPARIIDETQLTRLGDYQCVIVPSMHLFPSADWVHLSKYVEQGGNLLVPGSPELETSDPELSTTIRVLFGAKTVGFNRMRRFIPLKDEWLTLWEIDWLAQINITGAESLVPLSSAPDQEELARATPAVTVNRVGKGRAMLIEFDPFRQFSLYGNPQFVRLAGEIIRPLIIRPAIKITGAPSVVPGIRMTDDRLIVQLLNTARGQYDSAGLMNMASTFVFAEQIPPIGPFHISVDCPQKVKSVDTIPAQKEIKWTWNESRLEVDVPTIEIFTTLIAHVQPSAIASLGAWFSELPADVPLVTIHDELRETVGLVGSLVTPWPVEAADNRAMLWVGHNEREGLQFQVVALKVEKVNMDITAGPGHGRRDKLRHLSLSQNGKVVWRGDMDREKSMVVAVELAEGSNLFKLYCTDRATVLKHPNGDQRALVVALRRVEINPIK